MPRLGRPGLALFIAGLICAGIPLTALADDPACGGAPYRIMPLGNSITRGVIGSSDDTGYRRKLFLDLEAEGFSLDFVGSLSDGIPNDFDRDHEGRNGWTADQIRDHVYGSGADWLTQNPARIVLLEIGTNDIFFGQAVADIANEIEEILEKIDQYEIDTGLATHVLLARITNWEDPNSVEGLETSLLNLEIQALADARALAGDLIQVVDLENALTYPNDLDDEVHPNDGGYAKLADTWKAMLRTLLWGCIDGTDPNAPMGLMAAVVSDSRIDLSWNPASDPESGISGYAVYRDTLLWNVVDGATTQYADSDLEESTSYVYAVAAINGAGAEGPQSASAMAMTPADTTPPSIESWQILDSESLAVRFSEMLDPTSAESLTSYALNQGATLIGASLRADGRSVELTSNPFSPGTLYTLTVNHVTDDAISANTIEPDTQIRFSYSGRIEEDLVILYDFRESSGSTVHDVSGVVPALDLHTDDPNAISWTSGGLSIDAPALIASSGPATKLIEACTVSHEISLEAWAMPTNSNQSGPARMVSLSADPSNRNITLGQQLDQYDVRLRTTATSNNGIPSLASPAGDATPTLSHIVYTRDASGQALLYVDGNERASRVLAGDLSNWDRNDPLGLANELTEDRPWLGEFELVAFYSRALDPDEVLQNFSVGPDGGCALAPPSPNDPLCDGIDDDCDGLFDEDFAGGSCDCGDLNGDGAVGEIDRDLLRGHLTDPMGLPLSVAAQAQCNLVGSVRPCDILDLVVFQRALSQPALAPGIAPVCASATQN